MFRILRPTDLAALAIVTTVAASGVPTWLGIDSTPALIALTMGLACPAARRLIGWRRGIAPVGFGDTWSARLMLVAAMLPWLIVPGLRLLPWPSAAGIATGQVALPVLVQWFGAFLTVAGVVRPMVAAMAGTGRIRNGAHVEALGLFLATGSLFLGAMASSWLLLQVSRSWLPASAATGSAAETLTA